MRTVSWFGILSFSDWRSRNEILYIKRTALHVSILPTELIIHCDVVSSNTAGADRAVETWC